ncbi:Pimeloyl-ACP methyl ester carboxylesterase [Tistlia consotensis]|uniref:Pimeloyl-ACP methyl ester carboxylesterase n=1 Tax=Tistlia consotensis USBA 355 TaxID=560819 RepID=A0A1Y6BY63_9PROT|nr:alpha/beta fold hydrolase [Tistlia consotensis]SMF24136.1 Pimeloyl-ACP methyl ester carboxylesterase [Tistlia consotensis USBA 355]SNR60866.1 Pimeloyl-ACP methyl ester carboxylesterase [Tistlia consotensis]
MTGKTSLALLPGLLLDRTFWRHQEAALADLAEIRVADFSTQDSIEAMARSVLEMMPGRFALCGLSMGGYVALAVAHLAPERVERLCLMDTKAAPDSPENTARRRGLLELAAKGQFKGVTPKLLPLLIHEARLGDTDLTGDLMAQAERIGRDGFARQQTAIMTRPDARPWLAGIRCPTLVMVGRQDALTPMENATELAAGIPDSRLVVIDDCGHLPPLERPEETNRQLRRWLGA